MTYDPRYTTTTPVPPLNPAQAWPNRHTTDAEVERDWLENAIAELKAQLHAEHDRVADLQQTCAVLTELAQQLVDAAGAPWNKGWVRADPVSALAKWSYELREALDAAAELGITPNQP